jgi:hypothetical protein
MTYGPERYEERAAEDLDDLLWLDLHYTGAPDECNIHWPTKLVNNECPDCKKEAQDEERTT